MAKGKKGTAKSASSKPKYGSKYVNEIMEKIIDKKVSASLGKHANMVRMQPVKSRLLGLTSIYLPFSFLNLFALFVESKVV